MSLGIRTVELAAWAGVSESELVYALKNSGELEGVKIPAPLPVRGNARTRSFDYAECESFIKRLTEARRGV